METENGAYIRHGIYSLNFVMRLKKGHEDLNVDGCVVSLSSERYEVFRLKGTKCPFCGLEGSYFALEKFKVEQKNTTITNRYHFNLYGTNEAGEEIMFTKDHILPKSLGGINHMDNYRTMCKTCNEKRGNRLRLLP